MCSGSGWGGCSRKASGEEDGDKGGWVGVLPSTRAGVPDVVFRARREEARCHVAKGLISVENPRGTRLARRPRRHIPGLPGQAPAPRGDSPTRDVKTTVHQVERGVHSTLCKASLCAAPRAKRPRYSPLVARVAPKPTLSPMFLSPWVYSMLSEGLSLPFKPTSSRATCRSIPTPLNHHPAPAATPARSPPRARP